MSSSSVVPSSPSTDNQDEYPCVTQADLDRAKFRIGLKAITDEEEIERVMLAHSKNLKAILNAAEARIQATGGIRHEDFWSQLDAEYEIVESRGQETIDRAELERRLDNRSEPQPARISTTTPAIAEPKADYDVEAE